MNLDELKKLIAEGESPTLEFKKSTAKLNSACQSICAFLNAPGSQGSSGDLGGTVILGVNDSGKIVGQDVSDPTKREIANELSKMEPAAEVEIKYVGCEGDRKVICLIVAAGKHAPYTYDGRAYQRTESSTERMSQHRYEQALVDRGHLNHAWDEALTDRYTVDDLDHDEIFQVVTTAVRNRRVPASAAVSDVKDVLSRYKLIEGGKLTQAAGVLFAKDAGRYYTQCILKMARFRGKDKLGDMMDNKQIFGNAFQMLNLETGVRRGNPV